jgi:hypothetical protein
MYSWFAIRNAEILEDLTNELIYDTRERSPGKNRDVIINFFERVAKYKRKTYDVKSDGSHIEINYSWADVLANVIKYDIDPEAFNYIYLTAKKMEFSADKLIPQSLQSNSIQGKDMRAKIKRIYPDIYKEYEDYISFVLEDKSYTYSEMSALILGLENQLENR